MTRDLVLYRPHPTTEATGSTNSSATSYTIRPPVSTHSKSTHKTHRPNQETSRAMSHVSNRYPPPPPSSHTSSHTVPLPKLPSEFSRPCSNRSSSRDSVYSSGSSYTKITSISTQTFGSPDYPGYAPRQAPRRYFQSIEVRHEWDNAPVNSDGVKVKFRLGGGGRGSKSGCSEWGVDVTGPSLGSSVGSRAAEKNEGGFLGEDDDTVVPEDSISVVSSKRSRGGVGGSLGGKREVYRYPRLEDGQRDGGSCRLEESGVEVSNGKFVRVHRPKWAGY